MEELFIDLDLLPESVWVTPEDISKSMSPTLMLVLGDYLLDSDAKDEHGQVYIRAAAVERFAFDLSTSEV